MKRIAPDAQIIDITHGIPATSMLEGALVLANTIGFMPVGVHLAIVDPGVGGPRRPLALRDNDGRLYVGPDNGLLLPAVGDDRASRPRTSSRTRTTPSSRSRGRSTGVTSSHLPPRTLRRACASRSSGHPSIPESLVRLDLPEPVVTDGALHGDASLRRQFRQHRAEPRPRRCRGARDRLGHARRDRARGRALLRRHGADVRGRSGRRRDPLRGQLQEDVAGDLARERGADAACHSGAGGEDHARRVTTRPEVAARPRVAPARPAQRD